MDLREERELAYQRLLAICQSGLLSITDFRHVTVTVPMLIVLLVLTLLKVSHKACKVAGCFG